MSPTKVAVRHTVPAQVKAALEALSMAERTYDNYTAVDYPDFEVATALWAVRTEAARAYVALAAS